MRSSWRVALVVVSSACAQPAVVVVPPEPGPPAVVHLEDQLDGAVIEAPARASDATERVWSFAEPRPEWRTVSGAQEPRLATVKLEPRADGVHVALGRPPTQQGPFLIGGLVVDLDGLRVADWESVVVEARSHERLAGVHLVANVDDEHIPHDDPFFDAHDDSPPMYSDGSTQRYAIPLRGRGAEDEPLRNFGLFFGAPAPAGFDLLSVTLVPRGASFPEPYSVKPMQRDEITRRTLYAHTPARLTWHVEAPAGARVDVAFAALPGERVTYRVVTGGETLLALDVGGDEGWQQRSVDLSSLAGQAIDLTLEADGAAPGQIALWGAPVLSGEPVAVRPPNVIFYVIDGGGAETMSVYGYNRRTTPFLERLAREGVVFDHAYSNATWTQPSTASFMTSLQHSVLGGLRRGVHSTPIPAAATTMAEYMRAGGYLTASFTANPNAGRVIGIERGMDVQSDAATEHPSTSSPELHDRFWRWRQDYPAEPFFVHFQTTDTHEPNDAPPPFAGLYATPEQHEQSVKWDQEMWRAGGRFFGTTSIVRVYDLGLEAAGIERRPFYSLRRDLYDETMAYQDHQLQQFVEELKAAGVWDNTVLIIAADHGHPAGTYARWGRGLIEPKPEPWEGALFDAYATHVPLIVVWPGHLPAGLRVADQVSMIDVLPTILDLASLPPAEVAQGRSLVPLLRGESLPPRPVVLDEFRVDEATGQLIGNLDVVDGRWGASLEIGPGPDGKAAVTGRHDVAAGSRWGAVHPFTPEAPRLLLYDLWRDPYAATSVNDAHPDLVAKYTAMIETLWAANEALGLRYTEATTAEMTPEQLEQLEALGYVR